MLIVHNNENWKQAQRPEKWTNKAMAYASDEMSPGNHSKLTIAITETSQKQQRAIYNLCTENHSIIYFVTM